MTATLAMAFRRSSDITITSPRWLSLNRSALVECGIPTEILGDLRRWNYALLHGEDHFGCGWAVSWLSLEQCRKLLVILEAGMESDVGFDLVHQLRRIVSAGVNPSVG
jgi:hypothetical protein